MVEAQHPAESLGALDCAECRSQTIIGLDQPIGDPLVIPLPVAYLFFIVRWLRDVQPLPLLETPSYVRNVEEVFQRIAV